MILIQSLMWKQYKISTWELPITSNKIFCYWMYNIVCVFQEIKDFCIIIKTLYITPAKGFDRISYFCIALLVNRPIEYRKLSLLALVMNTTIKVQADSKLKTKPYFWPRRFDHFSTVVTVFEICYVNYCFPKTSSYCLT